MATATIARRPQALLVTETTSEPDRPAKRVKVEHHGEQSVPPACLEHDEADAVAAVPTHPLRVRPSGNAFGAPKNLRHAIKGPLILLPDAVLLQILENLDLPTLRTLGYTSKALWAFCHLDELWKSHYMR